MKQDIKQNWFFTRPVPEVWDYLTKPELLEQWLMKSDFKPVAGHKFQFHDSKGKVTHCQVLEVIPQKLLSYSWNSCTGLTIDSTVIWTLAEKNGGTELQLQHNGFKLVEELNGHTNGWNTLLNGLTKLLNTNSNADTNT